MILTSKFLPLLAAAFCAVAHAEGPAPDNKTQTAKAIVDAVTHNGTAKRRDARELRHQSDARAAAGDYAGAMELRLQILGVGQSDASEMGLLVYGATQPLAVGDLAPIASHLDGPACRKDAARLADIETKNPTYAAILANRKREKLKDFDEMAATPKAWQQTLLALFGDAPRDQDAMRKVPVAQIRANIEKVFALAQADAARPYGAAPTVVAVDPFTQLFGSPMPRARFLWTRLKTERLLVAAALVRRADRLEGRAPTAPLPDDPFGVGPLKEKNGVIYSIGPDGKDDGGNGVPSPLRVGEGEKGDVLAPTL